ncbi:MAG: hypothetical protein JXB39_11070 [Deltaproteobacteria bacterium]|nr:hypothetical protein [Deltaproteobacteria bacterium]
MDDRPTTRALREASRACRARASVLLGLASALERGDETRLARALERIRTNPEPCVDPEVAEAQAWLANRRATRRERFAVELRAACEREGVELVLLGRDPLELRLPPVSVGVDLEAGRAEVRFAGLEVRRTQAEADAVLTARAEAVAWLEGRDWDPAAWLAVLKRAWLRASHGQETWVELTDVLPEVALLRQRRRFRRDPTARNFEPYPAVRFAYDLWRARRDGVLSTDGWRLSLGPATGGSTRDRSRVLLLEDARGQGQYHLTLRFVREA